MKRKTYLFEILISGFLLVVMTVIRFSYIYDYIETAYGDTRFLEIAMIRQGAGMPYISSILAAVYTGGLRLIFWLAGNKEIAVVYVQAVMQILSLSMFYLACRKLCGIVFSAVVLFSVMFLQKGMWLMGELTPGNLFLLLISSYLLFFASALRRAEKKSESKFFFFFGFFWTGIFSGVLAAMDSYGIVLFLFSVILIALAKKLPFGYMTGAVTGMTGTFLLKCAYYGQGVAVPYREYYNNYFCDENWNPFFRFGISSMAMNLFLLLFLAGDILLLVNLRRKKNLAAQQTDRLTAIPEIAVADIEDMPLPKFNTVPYTGPEGTLDLVQEDGTRKEIKYIENPLPVPKRHVKKEMTYAFEPDAAHMCYDYEVFPENSDYDIE
ncbi:MAG: hypothetical protein GX234_05060 [Clostridiales bacterium]|nr:hypothetical protein [Clostridiales bacterium]